MQSLTDTKKHKYQTKHKSQAKTTRLVDIKRKMFEKQQNTNCLKKH